ncbi:MAG TPA: T9SS type A sorting domain-containing protein, partial [Ignavibacteriaceae bacterium]|nr:T9SS type A sorting domain-containing protein [Ignavibacteriaceae bacterium]
VDNAFWYSGDPVTNNGWINNYPYDQRILGNIGPFNLDYNKPVEVIVAYVVGKGDSHLNSITVAKSHSVAAAELYNSNFNKNASPGADRVSLITTNELGNNYPNPFNPLTKISYKIENTGHVTIKIYDVLGKEVALLVNQQKEPGIYSVEFNGSHLASGIYFYELRVNQFRQIKKMLLVR